MLGVADRTPEVRGSGNDQILTPIDTCGIAMVSMGLLIQENQPVIWRGPMLNGIIRQFLYQVEWGERDVVIVDLPPGTGDAQLTIAQAVPMAGAIIVTTPQLVSLADARRGLAMFLQMDVTVLGVVENMSVFIPPDAPAAGGSAVAAPPADPTPAPVIAAAAAPAPTADAAAPAPAGAAATLDDTIGPGSPDAAGTEESLRPLGEEERDTLLEMIRSLRPVEARRQFQIAFRHHFNVPKQERTIAGFITQQRHKDFIDRFERELADQPAPAAEAEASATAGEQADA
jgi:hypothetical protein